MKRVVLSLPGYDRPALHLAARLGVDWHPLDVHRFPDGELRVTIPYVIAQETILLGSLDNPNDKLVALQLACDAIRQAGADRLALVTPYLCYMRQDTAFHPGEVISQQVIGNWLSRMVDHLVTVDPHLHRIDSLETVIPDTNISLLHAAAPIREFLGKTVDHPVVVGPDEESEQWVQAITEPEGWTSAVAQKERHGDRKVTLSLPEMEWSGRHAVIVDDMISTGHTVLELTRILKQAGADPIDCMVVHALCRPEDERSLHAAGLRHLWSTDSIPHPTNVVELTELIAGVFTPPAQLGAG